MQELELLMTYYGCIRQAQEDGDVHILKDKERGTEMEQSYTQRTPSCLMLLAYAEDRLRPRIVATGSMMALQWMSPSGRPTYCLAA